MVVLGRLRRWQSRGLIVAPSAPAVHVCGRPVIFKRSPKPSLRGSRSTICSKIEAGVHGLLLYMTDFSLLDTNVDATYF